MRGSPVRGLELGVAGQGGGAMTETQTDYYPTPLQRAPAAKAALSAAMVGGLLAISRTPARAIWSRHTTATTGKRPRDERDTTKQPHPDTPETRPPGAKNGGGGGLHARGRRTPDGRSRGVAGTGGGPLDQRHRIARHRGATRPADLARRALREQSDTINKGNIALGEAMLINQAIALQSLFARLVVRVQTTELQVHYEAHMRFALRLKPNAVGRWKRWRPSRTRPWLSPAKPTLPSNSK